MRKYLLGLFYIIKGGFRKNSKSTLTQQQYRQVLLGAIYAQQQTAYINSLETGVNKSKATEIANEWWGIHNHEEAMDTLNYLHEDGFETLLPLVYEAYGLSDTESRKNFLINNLVPDRELTEDEKAEIGENLNKAFSQIYNLEETYDELIKRSIITCKEDILKYGVSGWDSGRLSFLSRICYDLSYISESETWDYQQKAYEQSKKKFNSWEDFAKSYIIGRSLWGGSDSMNSIIIDYAEELLKDQKSPWKEIQW